MIQSKSSKITAIYAKLACMGIKAYKVSYSGSIYYRFGKSNKNKHKLRVSSHRNAQLIGKQSIIIKQNTDIWKVIDYITDFYY